MSNGRLASELDIYFTWSHVLLDTCALAGVAVLCGKCGCFCPSSIKDADSDRQPVEKKKRRYECYMRSKLDEVSDPAYRHKIRGDDDDEAESELSSGQEQGEEEAASDPETFKEKKHRDMLCEKHEVSDEELWQQLHDVSDDGSPR